MVGTTLYAEFCFAVESSSSYLFSVVVVSGFLSVFYKVEGTFCEVGQRLLELEPSSLEEGGAWVSDIQKDYRISFQVGDAANTGLPNSSAEFLNLQFVAHKLPHEVTMSIIREASHILKDGGQFWFCKMDFEAPPMWHNTRIRSCLASLYCLSLEPMHLKLVERKHHNLTLVI